MVRILVIGGTGFIGEQISLEAARRKWDTIIVSKKIPVNPIKNKYITYKKINIQRIKSCKVLSKINFDYVVNASGYVDHSRFSKNGQKIIDQHFIGVINVIKNLNKKKIKKFIQIGSSEEYGDARDLSEKSKENPLTPYAFSKLATTHFLKMLYKSENFPSTIIRVFLTYGATQKKNRLIPYVISQCKKNNNFKILSSNYIRDFCHIDDIINAIFLCLVSKKSSGKVYNVGSGKGIRIKALVKLIQKEIKTGKPIFQNNKSTKQERKKLVADIREIKKDIKWYPKINNKDGIKKIIKEIYDFK